MMESPADLLRRCKVVVAPGVFTLVSLDENRWSEILSDSRNSPRMAAPFMIFKDQWEVTMLLDETDFSSLSAAVHGASVKGGFRLVSFDMQLDFCVVGFLSEVARILADADIPILAISAYKRDHILVAQEHLSKALVALGNHVEELC